jgi:hypothetical protein
MDLVGTAEINARHGIPKHRVLRFLRRGLWPEPLARLSCGLIFDGAAVAQAVANLQASGKLTRQ